MWSHATLSTVPSIPSYWARRHPDRIALKAGPLSLTWRQLDAAVNAVSAALRHQPEGPVAFVGQNVPEFWVAWCAANAAGRPFLPLNWRSTAHELAPVLGDGRPGVVLAQQPFADLARHAVDQGLRPSEHDVALVLFDSLADDGAGLADWAAPVAAPGPAPVTVRPDDVSLIAYTSGTTGQPKGVLIRHDAFDLFNLSDHLEPTITHTDRDVHLMVMPNFHLAGSWVSLPTLHHGGTVVMVPAFDPTAVLQAVQAHGVTTMCLVPTAIQALVDDPHLAEYDLSSLRTLIYAGSPIPAATIDRALDRLGCDLRQFYGTTETYIITILRPDDHRNPALQTSCGAPVPLVDIRVEAPDGSVAGTDEVGEVLVHSPMVMAGYLNNPSATQEVLRDGWYRTGDLGRLDATGNLHLVDRAKDMVVTGGENVYSVEVERALQQHPGVQAVAVIGTPDPRWGEAVTAFVVPSRPLGDEHGERADLAEELRRHCRDLIAGYKVPKHLHFVPSLPLSPSGKVRKVDLRATAHATGV